MTTQPTNVAVLSIHPLYDTRVANHLATLVDAGYNVTYINWSPPGALPAQPQLQRVTLVHREENPAFGWDVSRYRQMLRWMFDEARRCNADIHHLHDQFLLPLAPKLPGKVVYDIHENYARFGGKVALFERIARLLWLHGVDGFVTTCPANLPPTDRPTVIVPNCQRRSPFEPITPPQQRDDGPVHVVYVGSLDSTDRDVEALLDAAATCLDTSPEVVFAYAGPVGGDDAAVTRSRLDRLAHEYPKRFHYHGTLGRDRVIDLTRAADVGLIFLKRASPNLDGGSWNKIYEYLTVGAAIVATDGFDIAQQVRDAGAGVLLEPGCDGRIAARTLLAWIENRTALHAARQASAALGEQYDWETVSVRYMELYRRL